MSSSARVAVRVVAAVALTVVLAGCSALSGDGRTDERTVVTSLYPLAWVTEHVAGAEWTVTNLTSPGGEPHDLELSIGATADLAGATLVVYLSGFQPAVDDAVETNAEGEVLDAATVVDLVPVADTHADEHGAAPEEHSGHDHGDLDPHFWLDPERLGALATAVADRLAALDEAQAEEYRTNAADLVAELDALDREYARGLTGCERDTVVVSHDAFGYLAKYGLHLAPVAGLSPSAEPTPATLAELADLIRDEGITTVFSETLASPKVATTLASDLDVGTDVLDPLEGLTADSGDEDYFSIMRANLARLQEANGC